MNKVALLVCLGLAVSSSVHAEEMMPSVPSTAAMASVAALCVFCASQAKVKGVALLSMFKQAGEQTELEALPADTGEESCCEKVVTCPCDVCAWLMGPLNVDNDEALTGHAKQD